MNPMETERFSNLDKHWPIFDIGNVSALNLRHIQRQLINLYIRFTEMNKAGGDKKIHKPVELECLDAMQRQLASLVTDHGHFEFIFRFDLADEINHPRQWFRPRKHEFLE